MKGSILDLIGQMFMFGIFATPLLSLWYVRSVTKGTKDSLIFKIILGIFLTFLLAIIFFFIGMSIVLRDGLGPG